MTVQMKFAKHESYKGYFVGQAGANTYFVSKSGFGWHARLSTESGVQLIGIHNVDKLVYDNRGQAEEACSIHATKVGA